MVCQKRPTRAPRPAAGAYGRAVLSGGVFMPFAPPSPHCFCIYRDQRGRPSAWAFIFGVPGRKKRGFCSWSLRRPAGCTAVSAALPWDCPCRKVYVFVRYHKFEKFTRKLLKTLIFCDMLIQKGDEGFVVNTYRFLQKLEFQTGTRSRSGPAGRRVRSMNAAGSGYICYKVQEGHGKEGAL